MVDGRLKAKTATFNDFNVVAANMLTYSGTWALPGTANAVNGPAGVITGNWTVYVMNSWNDAGIITVTDMYQNVWFGMVRAGKIEQWFKVANATNFLPISGGTATGSITAPGLSANPTSSNGNAGVEISGMTPFIDFHFANDTGDYTTRFIESAIGQVSIVKQGGSRAKLVADIDAANISVSNLTVAGTVSTPNVKTASLALGSTATISFSETATGVMVNLIGNVNLVADGNWHDFSNIPTNITPPVQAVIMSIATSSGVTGVSNNFGFNLKLNFKPSGVISYRLASEKLDDSSGTYNPTALPTDGSTSWMK